MGDDGNGTDLNGFFGADTVALRDYAQRVQTGSGRLLELRSGLAAQIGSVDWIGPDAETFRNDFSSRVSALFDQVGGELGLWEAFDAIGFHLFFLLEGETLPEQLQAFIDPVSGAGEADGDVDEIPVAAFSTSAAAKRLGEARAVTTVLVLDRQDAAGPTSFTLFSTPDALKLMETDGEGEAALQRVGVISSATFTALVEGLVAGTRPGDADAQK